MKNNKTEVIGFRVTKDELEAIKKVAILHQKTVSQWCKELVVKTTDGGNKQLSLLSTGEQVILHQLLLLRFILTNTLDDKNLSNDKLKRIIERANELKIDKARQLIKEFIEK